ncbi:MAG: Ig-like domain-containing protein [Bacilli bacterium]|nr:Ig-like domain-containing protein [Bacilli bacterium]
MKSKIFKLFTFVVVILGLVLIGVHASAATPSMEEGAQIRTTGNQGLMFTATVDSIDGTTEHGFYLAIGEHTVSEMNTAIQADEATINGNILLKKQVEGENTTFKVVVINIPEAYYGQEITAVSYVVANDTTIVSSAAVTRSIGEVAVNMVAAGQGNDTTEDIIEALEANYKSVRVDAFNNVYVSNSVYETDPAKLEVAFLADWNEKFGTSFNNYSYSSWAASAKAGYGDGTGMTANGDTDCSGTNAYEFFITDPVTSAKWKWLLTYFLEETSTKTHPKRQINALLNKGSYSDSYGGGLQQFAHLSRSLQNFFDAKGTDIYNSNIDVVIKDFSLYLAIEEHNKSIYAIDADLKAIGDEVQLTALIKEGYTFDGYGTEKYNGNYTVTADSKFLEAKFTIEEYTIKYYNGSTELTDIADTYTIEDAVTLPEAYQVSGFKFEGWYDNEGCTGNPITAIEKGTIGSKVYYGKFTESDVETYTITYEFNGGIFDSGYKTSAEIGKAFFDDFCKYAGTTVSFETFHGSSGTAIKTALKNQEMIDKWNWLWVYMLADLKAYNGASSSSYLTDTYTVLEKLIEGDGSLIDVGTAPGPNARTLIRSYMHGVMHSMKGCGNANTTFAAYSPDYSNKATQQGLVAAQFETVVEYDAGAELPNAIKDGYNFDGWYDAQQNKYTTATKTVTLYAKWVEGVVVSAVEISNEIAELQLLQNHQLQWTITPSDAVNKNVEFTSSNQNVATIDENGLITAVGKGETTIKVTSLSSSGLSDSFVLKVTVPGYFDISYETESYVAISDMIKINAKYYDGDADKTIVWTSLNEDIASVTSEGYVTGLTAGQATIRATVQGEEVYQDFPIAVISSEVSEALQLVLDAHESNVFTRYELGIGSGTPNYYSDIFGSVSQLLYNESLNIDTTYNQATNEKYGDSLDERIMASIEFIAVHYTAGFNTGAGGASHGSYFAKPLSEVSTSIHYSVGNDGIYKGLDEQYAAAHAGDGSAVDNINEFQWTNTPVAVLPTDPVFPVVTITSSATFAINGRDTGIKVPQETKFGRGYVTDNKWLNDQGIAVNVKDGYYQVGTTWWCYSQVAEGRICSKGGNANSIGIETAVNKGSDLWYTWQKTAMLVADIMIRNNLDITKVKGHHFFAAKDCPQPMLENDLEIWWEFIELVEAEYERANKFDDVEFNYSTTSELLNNKGRVIGQNETSEVVTYTVEIVNGNTSETITLSSIVEGIYAK